MKIVTLSTIRGLVAKGQYSLPGEYDLSDDQAKDLIEKGLAKRADVVLQEAESSAGSVTVSQLDAVQKAIAPLSKAKKAVADVVKGK